MNKQLKVYQGFAVKQAEQLQQGATDDRNVQEGDCTTLRLKGT